MMPDPSLPHAVTLTNDEMQVVALLLGVGAMMVATVRCVDQSSLGEAQTTARMVNEMLPAFGGNAAVNRVLRLFQSGVQAGALERLKRDRS